MSLNLRRKMWRLVDPTAFQGAGLSWFNKGLIYAILLGVFVAILSTEPSLDRNIALVLSALDLLFAVVFSAEYLCRVWVAAEAETGETALIKRLRI